MRHVASNLARYCKVSMFKQSEPEIEICRVGHRGVESADPQSRCPSEHDAGGIVERVSSIMRYDPQDRRKHLRTRIDAGREMIGEATKSPKVAGHELATSSQDDNRGMGLHHFQLSSNTAVVETIIRCKKPDQRGTRPFKATVEVAEHSDIPIVPNAPHARVGE